MGIEKNTNEPRSHTYGITSNMLKSANLTQKEFLRIMFDYERIKGDIEHELGRLFWEFSRVQDEIGINSIKARAKDPTHLAEKIIRKRNDNKGRRNNPWVKLTADNYRQVVTDLGGLRTIMLFKEDWPAIHQHIIDKYGHRLKEDPVYNAPKQLDFPFCKSYLTNPVAHGSKFILKHVKTENGYASTHYIIESECVAGAYFEIQTRTAAEDLFGEISHKVRYPRYLDDDDVTKETISLSKKVSSVETHISLLYELHSRKEIQRGYSDGFDVDKTSLNDVEDNDHVSKSMSSWDRSALFDQIIERDRQIIRTMQSIRAIPGLQTHLQDVLSNSKGLGGVTKYLSEQQKERARILADINERVAPIIKPVINLEVLRVAQKLSQERISSASSLGAKALKEHDYYLQQWLSVQKSLKKYRFLSEVEFEENDD